MAESCLKQWRKIPYLQMKGSDETFIAKVAVVLGQCPVPSCPPEMMGVHKTLPTGCLEWWIEKGPLLLGWKGVDGSTTAKEMMQKIQFQSFPIRKVSRIWNEKVCLILLTDNVMMYACKK